jgi:hypothetical protein
MVLHGLLKVTGVQRTPGIVGGVARHANTTLLSVNSDMSVRTPYGGAFIAQARIARGNGYDLRCVCTSTGMYVYRDGNRGDF